MASDKILLIGGSGLVGRATAHWLNALHPDQGLLIGSRNIETARKIASGFSGAEGVAVDLARPDLGLDPDLRPSAIAVLAPEHGVNALSRAMELGVPYLNIGIGMPDVGPELAWFAFHPKAAPILLTSHWMGGAAAYLALDGARHFDRVDSIRIGTVVDTEDEAGPAALEDMERLHQNAPANMAFRGGHRVWLSGEDATAEVEALDGRKLTGAAFSSFDIASIQAATRASDVRFDIAADTSSSRLRGGPIAIEIAVEIEGRIGDDDRRWRGTLEFDKGQGSLTGLGAALSLSRLLGLAGGPALLPGLYMPENLAEVPWYLDRLTDAGARIETALD